MSDDKGQTVKNGVKKGVSIVGKVIKWIFLAILIIIVLVIGYSVYTCTAVTKAVVDVAGGSPIVQNAVKDAIKEATGVQDVVETVIDGQTYTQINPKELAFNIGSGTVKKGERYVFDDTCFGIEGNTLLLTDVGVMNQITLTEFVDYSMGTKLRVYVVVEELNEYIKSAKFKGTKIMKM
jgi:hypothetical protein